MPDGPTPLPASQLAEVLRVYGITRSFMTTASITGTSYEAVCDVVRTAERHAKTTASAAPPEFLYRWRLRKLHPDRFGRPCRPLDPTAWHHGPQARIVVEFEDGLRVDTVRLAIRKARGLLVATGPASPAADNRVAAPARGKPGG